MTLQTGRHCLAWAGDRWALAFLDGNRLTVRWASSSAARDEGIASGVGSYALAGDGAGALALGYVVASTLWVRLFQGGRWSQPFGVATRVGALPVLRTWCQGGAQRAEVVWGSAGGAVWSRRYSGTRWDSPMLLDGDVTAGFPALAGDGGGGSWAAWRVGTQDSGYQIRFARRDADTLPWEGWGHSIAGMDPDLALDDGILLLGYHQGGKSVHVATFDADGSGEAPLSTSRLDTSGLFVGVAAGAGRRLATWSHWPSASSDAKDDTTRTVRAATASGSGAWSVSSPTTATGYQVQPGPAVGPSGPAVAWADLTNNQVRLVQLAA